MALTYDPVTGLATGTSTTGVQIGGDGSFSFGTGGSAGTPDAWTYNPGHPGTAPTLPGINLPSLPDLTSLYTPIWSQMTADVNAGGIADAAARDAARQRAIIQFGEAPSFGGADLTLINGGGDMNAFLASLGNAPQLAQQNTAAGLSTEARLQDADKQAQMQITNALGARGLTQSGESGYQLGREALNYATSQYDSRQKLLDFLSGVQSQFVTGERQRQQALTQLALQKAQVAGEQQTAAANWQLQQQLLNAQTAFEQAQLDQAAANANIGAGWSMTPGTPGTPGGSSFNLDTSGTPYNQVDLTGQIGGGGFYAV